MREHKYRAWHKTREVMVHFDIMTITKTYHPGYWHTADLGGFDCELDDPNLYSELMEYTGQKDKNGTEYADSDIMQWIQRDYTSQRLEKVFWNDGCWWVADLITSGLLTRLTQREASYRTIIGNIHENPELKDNV